MVLRDLSFWGIVKLSLILELLVTVLLSPFLILYVIVAGGEFELGTGQITVLGVKLQNFDLVGTIPASIIGVLFGLTLLLIHCAILHFVFQKTCFGNISIGW